MAKTVTKTFLVTTVTAKVADTSTDSIELYTVKLHGVFKDLKALEKALRFEISKSDRPLILLKIENVSTDKKQYQMSTRYFINHATELN